MEQSGKKIGDEEGIGEDQCPTNYSFKVNLNFSSFSRCVNTENLPVSHPLLPRQFCEKSAILWNYSSNLPIVQPPFHYLQEGKTTENN